MYSVRVFLSLVGLLSGASLVTAAPPKEPGDVHLAFPKDYKDEHGNVHLIAKNHYAQTGADRHPVIISGPPVAHKGGPLYPAIPVTSSDSGHPVGVSNVRHSAESYNQHGGKAFKKNSQVALGEGLHVNGNKLSNTFPPWSLHRDDKKKLLQDDHNANPSVSPSRGRQRSRTPSATGRGRDRSPSREPGPSRNRDRLPTRNRGPSRDRNRSASPRRGAPSRNRAGPRRSRTPPRNRAGPRRSRTPPRNRAAPRRSRTPPRNRAAPRRQRTPPRNHSPSRGQGSSSRYRSPPSPRRGQSPRRGGRY